jgi:hypothetical protein
VSVPTPEDVGLAGRGDLGALRRMRDHWLPLATGEVLNPILPKNEALPQLELLAEMAASATGQPEDWVALLYAYCVRIQTLKGDISGSQHFANEAVGANSVDGADRWTRSVVELEGRLNHYRAKVADLVSLLLTSNEVAGAAMLVSALSREADSGDESAVPVLQFIMDSVTPERASAISAAVRKLEGATTQ